jgi:hypothetical protein
MSFLKDNTQYACSKLTEIWSKNQFSSRFENRRHFENFRKELPSFYKILKLHIIYKCGKVNLMNCILTFFLSLGKKSSKIFQNGVQFYSRIEFFLLVLKFVFPQISVYFLI